MTRETAILNLSESPTTTQHSLRNNPKETVIKQLCNINKQLENIRVRLKKQSHADEIVLCQKLTDAQISLDICISRLENHHFQQTLIHNQNNTR